MSIFFCGYFPFFIFFEKHNLGASILYCGPVYQSGALPHTDIGFLASFNFAKYDV